MIIKYPFTPETKDQVISDVVDDAVERYAQFLDPSKRNDLVKLKWGHNVRRVSSDVYHICTENYERFRKEMYEHCMQCLMKRRHPSIRLSMDYGPEDDLCPVTYKLMIPDMEIFPCKTYVSLRVKNDHVIFMHSGEI